MADCRKYRDMISCYADGELSENDINELLGHLEECASCRSLLSLYKSLTGAAAETLREPPDNFANSIMEKIRLLPENDKTNKPAANKSKSLRPVVISFVAAAACLALAFIVSPQLLGLRGMSNTAASMPSSIASAAASQEAAYDNSAQDSVMKAAEGADTGAAVEDGAGTAPQTQFGITAATEAPQPSVSQAPDFAASGRDYTDELKDYYAVFVIVGLLPDVLKDYGMTDNQDGTFSIEISIETVNQLTKDGFKPDMGAPEVTIALVKYTPAS